MDPSPAHRSALDERRRWEDRQEKVADIHRLAEERRRAREASARWLPVSVRSKDDPHYLTRY